MLDQSKWIRDDIMSRPHKMTAQALEALALLAAGKQTIIEVGVFCGAVTRLFSLFCDDVHAVDWFKGDWAAGAFNPEVVYGAFLEANQQAVDAGRVKPYTVSSAEGAKLLTEAGVTADLIWIDADHSYEGCKQDIVNYLPLLKPGGVLCGHDAGTFPGVNQAVGELLPNAHWLGSWIWVWTQQQAWVDSKYLTTFEKLEVPALKIIRGDGETDIALSSVAEEVA